MRKIIKLFLPVLILCLLAGCSKLISTEYKDVEVKIIDCYHEDSYTTYVPYNKSFIPVVYFEVNKVTVSYNNNQYVIKGEEVYYKYKDKIGETVTGTLEIENYEDGTKKFNIVSLS
jgi:hypothetical protein